MRFEDSAEMVFDPQEAGLWKSSATQLIVIGNYGRKDFQSKFYWTLQRLHACTAAAFVQMLRRDFVICNCALQSKPGVHLSRRLDRSPDSPRRSAGVKSCGSAGRWREKPAESTVEPINRRRRRLRRWSRLSRYRRSFVIGVASSLRQDMAITRNCVSWRHYVRIFRWRPETTAAAAADAACCGW